ncbi:MAG: hypothetical protein MR779_00395 [Tenericutes bacterium]|nr:hypothetical protein [Mycoplasmatota bacterium]
MFRLRHDNDTGYPKYDEIQDEGTKTHVHRWGGYSKTEGEYYEGGHGEYTDDEEKKEAGKIFRKERGDE